MNMQICLKDCKMNTFCQQYFLELLIIQLGCANIMNVYFAMLFCWANARNKLQLCHLSSALHAVFITNSQGQNRLNHPNCLFLL